METETEPSAAQQIDAAARRVWLTLLVFFLRVRLAERQAKLPD